MIQTSAAVSTRPVAQAPNKRICAPVPPRALSGMIQEVTNQKAISDSAPAMARPLYSAGMTFFMPGDALTKKQPMMLATMETAPSASGYSTAFTGAAATISAPSTMVAISVTA